jgi:hypothetical protein
MKTWEKPQLIVVVRSKPEEAVLQTCKYAEQTGPETAAGGCALSVGLLCALAPIACQEVVPS